MLEKMDAFFEARLNSYDKHMLANIQSAEAFYPFTAKLLPCFPNASLLDLGCGTSLELEYYFELNPDAKVTGIDLSLGMLNELLSKFPQKKINVIHGSYFHIPFENEMYDAAVSVESLHHFTQQEKIPLYQKLHHALKENGYFILTDYFASNDEEEKNFRAELAAQKAQEGITDDDFYHFDTPLTVFHETEALLMAGFSHVEEINSWGATHTLKAYK